MADSLTWDIEQNVLWTETKVIHKAFQAIMENSLNLPGFVGRTKTSSPLTCFARQCQMVILREPKQNLPSYVA